MKTNNLPLLSVLLAVFLTACTIASTTISKEVMDRLDKLYKKPIKDEKLKQLDHSKLVTLLGVNYEHRQSLENTVEHRNKNRFKEQVHHIIDQEMAKLAWTYWDYVEVLVYSNQAKLSEHSIRSTITVRFCTKREWQRSESTTLSYAILFGRRAENKKKQLIIT